MDKDYDAFTSAEINRTNLSYGIFFFGFSDTSSISWSLIARCTFSVSRQIPDMFDGMNFSSAEVTRLQCKDSENDWNPQNPAMMAFAVSGAVEDKNEPKHASLT